MAAAEPRYSKEEFARRGDAIYAKIVRPRLNPKDEGKFAAIDIETETYLCAAAQTGSFTVGNEQRQTYGHSLIADPWGHVIAKASDGPGVVSARLAPARDNKVRAMIPVAGHKVRITRG